MTTAWDSYVKKELRKPAVKKAYEEETQVLKIGLALANQRRQKGLTQAEVAEKIGVQCSAAQPNRAQTGKRQHANLDPVCRSGWHGPRYSPCCAWITYP